MADYHFTIDGIERQVRRGSLRLVRRANVRPTLDCEILSLDGTFIPAEGAAMLLTENGDPLFGGRIQHPSTAGVDGEPLEALATRIDCIDNNAKADDLYLRTTFPGGTVKDFFQWAVTNYLGPQKGTTLDPTMPDGPVMPVLPYTYRSQKRVSDGLTDACTFAVGWSWNISASNVLTGRPPDAMPAPFDIADGDPRVIGDVRFDKTSAQYANRIIVAGRTDPILYYKDEFTDLTDGARTVFPLRLMPVGDYPHFPNAGVVYVQKDDGEMYAETFGMLGAADSTWQYDPDANTIIDTGDAGGPPVTTLRPFPLPLHRPMWIVYTGTPEAIAIAEDLAAQSGPKGVVERVISSDLQEQSALDAQAAAELIKALATPQTVVYDTDELGLAPGQLQTIVESWRGINGQFVIQQVETRDVENVDDDDTPLLRHTVTAVEYLNGGTAYPGTVGDLFTQWSKDSNAGPPPTVTPGEGLTIPGTNREVFYNDAGVWGAAADQLYDKDGSGARYGPGAVPARAAVLVDDDGLGTALDHTSTPQLAYPPAALGLALTPTGTAWSASPTWVQLIASTPAEWTLGHLAVRINGTTQPYEIEVGLGAAGAEVVVATLAAFSGAQGFTGFQILRFPVPYGPVPAGTRIALRIRNGATDTGVYRVALGYWSGTPAGALSRTLTAAATFPAASTVGLTASATPWANSAFVQLLAATADVLTVAYLQVQPSSGNDTAWEIDIATGAAGAEVVVTTIRADNEAAFWSMGPGLTLLRPMLPIPAGVRVALRVRKSGTSTGTYTVRLGGYYALARPELVTARPQVARPAAADSLALTTSGSVGVPGAWVQFDAALAAAFAITALAVGGAQPYTIDLDLGYGAVGAETVAATVRHSGDNGNNSGVVTFHYAVPIPAGARLVARAVGLDVSSVTRTLSLAIAGILSPDFTQLAAGPVAMWPIRAVINNAQTPSSWANSGFAELIADSGAAAEVITALGVKLAFGDEAEIDLAFGAAGSEVVATTYRTAGEGNTTSHAPWCPLDAPLLVPAHSRVTYRTRRNANATTQAWQIAVLHTPAVTTTGAGARALLALANRAAGLPDAVTVVQTNDGLTTVRSAGGIRIPDLLLPESQITFTDITTGNVSTTAHGFAPKAPGDATKFLDGTGAWASITEAKLVLSDVTTGNVSTTAHGFVPKAPNDTTKFLRGDGTWAAPPSYSAGAGLTLTGPVFSIGAGQVVETMLGLSDVTIANASTSAHGLLPKLPGDATKFLDGTGAWSTPGAGGVGTHYDAPLTDGDPVAADLIFAGGECVIVQVPV